jgi:hypothetical protein
MDNGYIEPTLPNEKRKVAREFTTTTLCEIDSEGYWKSTSTMIDRARYEGDSEWVEEKLDAMSIDSDIQSAIQTSMASCLTYMNENVFKNGFTGLLEYREFQRSLENASKA